MCVRIVRLPYRRGTLTPILGSTATRDRRMLGWLSLLLLPKTTRMSQNTAKAFGASQPREEFRTWDTSKCTHDIDSAIAELEREANVRMKCYDRWVADGKMTREDATKRMGSLVSAWHFLQTCDAAKQLALQQETCQQAAAAAN